MSSSKTPTEALASPPKSSKTYNGSCHCGRFKYKIQSPPLTDPGCEVTECNCSICSRNAYLYLYVPHSSVTFEKGSEEEFTKYSWTGKFAHLFCSTCGTSCMSKSLDPNFYADFKAVNVRTFEGVDLKKLRVKEVDGKSFNPDA